MAAQSKEVIVNANWLNLQDIAPGRREGFLDRGAGRGKRFVQIGARAVWFWESFSINLAIGSQWQLLELDEARRQHVWRKRLGEKGPQFAGRDGSSVSTHPISDQALAGRRIAFDGDDRRCDRRVPACLLYTSDAADDLLCVDLGGRRII